MHSISPPPTPGDSVVLDTLLQAAAPPGIVQVEYTVMGYRLPGYHPSDEWAEEWPLMESLRDLESQSHIEIVEDNPHAYVFIPRFLLTTSNANKMRSDQLRLMAYSDYLNTWEWQQKVRLVRLRDLNQCQNCGRCNEVLQMQVHHKTYKRRGIERLSDLTTLCAHCHYLTHRQELEGS